MFELDLENEELKLVESVGFGYRCKTYSMVLAKGIKEIIKYLIESRRKDPNNEVYNILLNKCYEKKLKIYKKYQIA